MRRFVLAVFVAGVVALNTGAARSDDAQSLLAKNKAFAGWTFGDPSMMDLRLEGAQGENTIVDLRRGAVWRRTISYAKSGLSSTLGYTGKLFWTTNQNGFTVPILGDGVKYDIAYQVVMNQGIPLLDGTLGGTETVNGVQAQIVRVQPPRAHPIDAYIDPSTGKLVRAVIDPDGTATKIDVLGYTAVDGKQVISKWHILGPDAEFTKIVRTTIPDAAFHPPSPSATWTFGPPNPIPVTVGRDRIVIRAIVDGVAGNFILDSGASGIALNSDFADRAHLKAIRQQTSYGVSGPVHTSIAHVDAISVGQHTLHNVYVSIGINIHSATVDYDGLLGFDFLAGAIVDVDLQKQLLTIYDPQKYAVTAKGPEVVVDLANFIPTVPVTLDGRVKGHLAFDTGDPMAVVASGNLYGPPRGVAMRLEGYAKLGGVGGQSQKLASCGHMNTISIDTLQYTDVPICFAPSGEPIFGNDGGIIGFDFLKHFDLTFDYPDSAIFLTPIST